MRNSLGATGNYMRYLMLSLILTISTACLSFTTAIDELQRIPSPDHRFEAVLVRSNCGATCQLEYDVYIVPPGAKGQEPDQVFHVTSAEDLKLAWLDSNTLDISLRCGRIKALDNFFWPPNGPPVIEVRLKLPSDSSTLCEVDQHWKRGTGGA